MQVLQRVLFSVQHRKKESKMGKTQKKSSTEIILSHKFGRQAITCIQSYHSLKLTLISILPLHSSIDRIDIRGTKNRKQKIKPE